MNIINYFNNLKMEIQDTKKNNNVKMNYYKRFKI